jgi:hypothetical protein
MSNNQTCGYVHPVKGACAAPRYHVTNHYYDSAPRAYTRPPMRREVADDIVDALREQFASMHADWEVLDANHAAPGASVLSVRDRDTGAEFSVTIATKYAGANAPVSIPQD